MDGITKMKIDDDLKADLLYSVDVCRDFSMCLPVEKAKHPLKQELGTAIGFMKCFSMHEVSPIPLFSPFFQNENGSKAVTVA